jgi:hypothetical protein
MSPITFALISATISAAIGAAFTPVLVKMMDYIQELKARRRQRSASLH